MWLHTTFQGKKKVYIKSMRFILRGLKEDCNIKIMRHDKQISSAVHHDRLKPPGKIFISVDKHSRLFFNLDVNNKTQAEHIGGKNIPTG